MIHGINGHINALDILPKNNICIVHYLDLNINLTKDYLMSAWTAGSFGANDIYLSLAEDTEQLSYLNFSQIFDFQRVLMVTFFGVRGSCSFQ